MISILSFYFYSLLRLHRMQEIRNLLMMKTVSCKRMRMRMEKQNTMRTRKQMMTRVRVRTESGGERSKQVMTLSWQVMREVAAAAAAAAVMTPVRTLKQAKRWSLSQGAMGKVQILRWSRQAGSRRCCRKAAEQRRLSICCML
jgi:hypothetical protein